MRRWIASGLIAAVLAGLSPGMALAGSGGRRNTALGLTAGALYTWFNGGFKHAGRRNTALVLTAGSVMAWHKYKQKKRDERRRERYYAYRSYRSDRYYSRPASYTRGYRSYYGRPVSYTRGYRSYYGARRYSSRTHRRGSMRYCQTAYRRGYRAGYRAGARATA
jgi:hypothetical protein